ncbi:unnamed protein product [Calicophoron daubneyi]|uniref:CTLH domain-containing protein n=1 Tax=Calicophoron daubneyi TaxID=300641 RepID=A0AAV2SYD0_CALDB
MPFAIDEDALRARCDWLYAHGAYDQCLELLAHLNDNLPTTSGYLTRHLIEFRIRCLLKVGQYSEVPRLLVKHESLCSSFEDRLNHLIVHRDYLVSCGSHHSDHVRILQCLLLSLPATHDTKEAFGSVCRSLQSIWWDELSSFWSSLKPSSSHPTWFSKVAAINSKAVDDIESTDGSGVIMNVDRTKLDKTLRHVLFKGNVSGSVETLSNPLISGCPVCRSFDGVKPIGERKLERDTYENETQTSLISSTEADLEQLDKLFYDQFVAPFGDLIAKATSA